MKFAFMSFSTPEMSLDQMLTLAREIGYDGIEPRLDAGHAHGVEAEADEARRESIREAFADAPVELACLATSCQFANPAEHEQMLADARERIELAGDLGAPCVRVFGGNYPDSMSRSDAVDAMTDALNELAPLGAERNVTICVETHDAWCDPAHLAAVMQKVDHGAIGVNWDVMHPVRTGLATIDESFELLRPWIRHTHVHDGDFSGEGSTLVPIGNGEVDHRRAIERLQEISFDGFLSGEWINWEPAETHLPRELATLQSYV